MKKKTCDDCLLCEETGVVLDAYCLLHHADVNFEDPACDDFQDGRV